MPCLLVSTCVGLTGWLVSTPKPQAYLLFKLELASGLPNKGQNRVGFFEKVLLLTCVQACEGRTPYMHIFLKKKSRAIFALNHVVPIRAPARFFLVQSTSELVKLLNYK